MSVDAGVVAKHVEEVWAKDALPALHDYIRIPNVSPAYAADWSEQNHMTRAVELIRAWCAARPVKGASVNVFELPGRTPLLVIDVPAFGGGADDDTVLLYGHLDKQPPMAGWRDGLGPWEPVVQGDRLYGRGGADDGYAAFATLTAIEAVEAAGGAHGRCVVLVEASEESGSPDLPAHMEALGTRLGTPSLVVALDSSGATYDQLWLSTSLRGLLAVRLTVEILTEGVHSGLAGGVVPSSFRILRHLLSRIEDDRDGELLLPELFVDIPPSRVEEAQEAAAELGDAVASHYPFVPAATPLGATPAEQLLNRTWRPALATVGIDGIPPTAEAGNVLRPYTTALLSIRLPPTCEPVQAGAAVKAALEEDPPYGARVTAEVVHAERGWDAPVTAPWLAAAVDEASVAAFGQPARAYGVGGSIPFMAMLGDQFPEAQFVITGVLGPESNAHGPNEFLHIPTAVSVTKAVAHILDAHARR